jgi:hypothetical protein
VSDPEEEEAREAFRKRLAETIHWCAMRLSAADPRGSLRSLFLKPGSLGAAGEPPLPRGERHLLRQEEVETLASRRLEWVKRDGFGYWKLPPELGGGRLLLYEPDRSEGNGKALEASGGFFDPGGAPPWDTWVCYFADDPGYLLAWIPGPFLQSAEGAVRAAGDGSLAWAKEKDTELTRRLGEWGMLG